MDLSLEKKYHQEDQEKDRKNKMAALVITIFFHIALIAVLMFTIAWEPPNPPPPQYGIEINFGLDDAGAGEMQSTAPANDNESLDEAKPETAEPVNEPEPEVEPETTPPPVTDPITTPPDAVTPIEEPIAEEPLEEIPEAVVDEAEESVETVSEETEIIEEPKPEPQPEKPIEEPKPEPEKPSVNNDALLGPPKKESQDGTSEEAEGNTNGDQQGVGDQGKKDGELNADALLAKGGKGGNASSLDMPGWTWDKAPEPDDTSNETGKIVFEIKIDDSGEILSVKTVYRSVTNMVAKAYERSLYQLLFEPTSLDGDPPPITTGKVTFIITTE